MKIFHCQFPFCDFMYASSLLGIYVNACFLCLLSIYMDGDVFFFF